MSNLISYTAATVANDAATTFILDTDAVDTTTSQATTSFEKISVYIDVSATPTTGTMDLSVRPRGSSSYRSLKSDIDLTSGARDYEIDAIGIDAVKLTPSSFDAGKTYDVLMFGKDL